MAGPIASPNLAGPNPGSTPRSVLSPSRASDFLTCPLRYRFRVLDKIPERPTPEAARGTVVHAVLERLFELPPDRRTITEALELVRPQWDALIAAEPELATLFSGTDGAEAPTGAEQQAAARDLSDFLSGAHELLDRYFSLEDPRRLEPAERELYVECELNSGLRLRGYVDRLDVAQDGAVRVVDYKTGKAPRESFERRALFQMRFYALMLWHLRGEIPRMLQLIYLGSGEVLRDFPDEQDLRATERKLEAVWSAISRAHSTGDWRASPGPLCHWCDHQVRCPAWGGTPPPLPTMTPTEEPAGEAADAPTTHTPGIDL